MHISRAYEHQLNRKRDRTFLSDKKNGKSEGTETRREEERQA